MYSGISRTAMRPKMLSQRRNGACCGVAASSARDAWAWAASLGEAIRLAR